ncbi:hypothetical protein BpHYR1_018631 [Brachionus plicatilis]|uniref:Uncharacterized protein n=1 Tax=Brachionus plicatilis TaxID=10195 RepID=A0A3M7RUS0_BRAPC|nr:hypothetical protein BpHYR1_018631 [Brachionus plicatilis]
MCLPYRQRGQGSIGIIIRISYSKQACGDELLGGHLCSVRVIVNALVESYARLEDVVLVLKLVD